MQRSSRWQHGGSGPDPSMTVSNGRLGVAVAGLGVGRQHAKAYLETGVCQLRWVYDIETDRARDLVGEVGEGRVARSFEQLLEDPDVGAVSIASYDDAHFGQVVSALDAGKHVFVEKPMCRTYEELAAIKAAWQRHEGRVKLSSNLVLRSAPVYKWLKEAISGGEIGHLYAFDGEYLYGRLAKITEGWRKDVDGYSVMLGGGIHLIDLMMWLTGERPKRAYASGNRVSTRETAFRYDDYVAVTLDFPSGLVARIAANFGAVHRHQHVVRVFGTESTFLYDDAGPRLHESREPSTPPTRIDLATLPESKGELIGPFVAGILADAEMNGQTSQIFDAISVCAASDAALKAGSPVEVRYV